MSHVNLAHLFPGISHDAITGLRQAADLLDAARPPNNTPQWEWFPENSLSTPPPELSPWVTTIVTTSVSLFDTKLDWLELSLSIEREQPPKLNISASIEVACHCETNHNMHVAHDKNWTAESTEAMVAAFESAAKTLTTWL